MSESSISDTEILRILYSHNPWWANRPIPKSKLKDFKRRDYYKIIQQLDRDTILAMIGARRVGKTTLLYQLIEELLERTDSKNILFLNKVKTKNLLLFLKAWYPSHADVMV